MKLKSHVTPCDMPDKVCKFNQSIYGSKQSGRVWNETINKELVDMGFARGGSMRVLKGDRRQEDLYCDIRKR